jgi:hypothetical protein
MREMLETGVCIRPDQWLYRKSYSGGRFSLEGWQSYQREKCGHESRGTVLVKASNNLAVSQSVSFRCKWWLVRAKPLWSSGQSSWLQIQRSGLDSRHYQILWEVVGLERGPLSFVSTIEELLERKSSGSGLESREYGRRDPSHWPHGTLYPQKLALTSPTSGGRSVGIVRSRTQATEFSSVGVST